MEILREGRWRLLLVCWLGWVLDFQALILFPMLKSLIGVDIAISESDYSWISGLSLAATGVGGVAIGRFADRVGRRPAFVLAVASYSLGSLLTACATDYWSLLLARIFTGLGVGGEWGVGHAIVAESVPARMRGRAAGILQAGSPVAMALGALLSGYASEHIGWRGCFCVASSAILLTPFAWFLIPETRNATADDAPRPTTSALELVRPPLLRSSVVVFALLTLNMAGFWCTYNFLYSYLATSLGQSLREITHIQWVISCGHLIGNLSFGYFADRFSRRAVFATYAFAYAAGTLGIALGFHALSQTLALFVGVIAVVGLGSGNWSCFGALFADLFPARVRGTASSGFYNISRSVQLVAFQVVLFVSATAGIPNGQAGLYLGAGASFLAALVARALPAK
ncbi:MAG: MFS transporter [Planctomycetota bacterium]